MNFLVRNIFFAPKKMKKRPPSKVAPNRPRPFFQYCQSAQIKPKSQFLFHKNLPPQDFSIMTLPDSIAWLFRNRLFSRKPHQFLIWAGYCQVLDLYEGYFCDANTSEQKKASLCNSKCWFRLAKNSEQRIFLGHFYS